MQRPRATTWLLPAFTPRTSGRGPRTPAGLTAVSSESRPRARRHLLREQPPRAAQAGRRRRAAGVVAAVDGGARAGDDRGRAPGRSRACTRRRSSPGCARRSRRGLVDDLDWLAPAAAGAALYELASALPLGPEQRELGRRVLARLVAADAETFVAIARRMALGGGRGLGERRRCARAIALVAELPIGAGVADGPLALALASRRELAREWIARAVDRLAAVAPPGGAPARARRARGRAAGGAGDDHSLRVFQRRRGGAGVGAAPRRPRVARLAARRRRPRPARAVGGRSRRRPIEEALAADALADRVAPRPRRRIAARRRRSPPTRRSRSRSAPGAGPSDARPGRRRRRSCGACRAPRRPSPRRPTELLDAASSSDDGADELGEAVARSARRARRTRRSSRGPRRARRCSSAARRRSSGDDGAEALAQEMARDLDRRRPRRRTGARLRSRGALGGFRDRRGQGRVRAGARRARRRARARSTRSRRCRPRTTARRGGRGPWRGARRSLCCATSTSACSSATC